ncbi:Chemotaxis response regulator protein-glutamate methylesterase of group 2 operon [compost metagenome]
MIYQVMVVDDSAFMRKIVSDLIEQDPVFHVVGTAKNGREAIEMIAKLSPDLVTMDVEMPELNGLEALKVIMSKHPLPVIMLSGINEQGMQETIMALELGAFDFIRKPSVSTSSHDIEEVGRQLREQIRAAMLAKERKLARQAALEKKLPEIMPPKVPKTPPIQSTRTILDNSASDKGNAQNLDQRDKPTLGFKNEASTVSDNKSSVGPSKSGIAPPAVSTRKKVKDMVKPLAGKQAKDDQQKAAPSISRKKLSGENTDTTLMPPPSSSIVDVPVVKDTPIDLGRASPPLSKKGFTDLVAIGTSTGGPKALKAVLEKIPAHFPAPIVIVQHMPANFTKSLAQRLDSLSALNVVEAEEGMELLAGTAYIAPGGHHMNVSLSAGGKYKLNLSEHAPRSGHRPSVDVLYESLLPLESLKRHVVLLTGMGSDGAKAMKKLYDSGVTSTIAESEETCVVYGMPRSAVELGCVNNVLPLNEIGLKLVQIVK